VIGSRPQLTAIVVSSDKDVLGVVERALLAAGDSAVLVMDIAEAIAIASSRDAAIAFIDVTLAGTGGLALVHHLLAVRPDVSIYVMAPPTQLTHALEGLALGATGILPLPATGDSVMRAMSEVRAKKEAASRVADLEHQLHLVRNTVRQMQRVAKLAAGAPRRELARASAEAIAESCGAMAVAVYFTSEKQAGSFVRVADVGGGSLPEQATDSELDALAERPERVVLPLRSEQRTLGRVVIEVDEGPRREIAADLVAFTASLLALAGTTPKPSGEMPRVAAPRSTSQVASREEFDVAVTAAIAEARVRSGRVSVASIISAGAPFSANPEVLANMFAAVRKKSDALGRAGDEILLLLPDTGAVGAQLLRKRLDTVVAGVATFPQDGDRPEILLDRARLRRAAVVRSPIRDLDQRVGGLRAFVDALLEAPLVDSGVGSPYPLELSPTAAASLVYYTCVEARRGGMPWIMVTEPSEKRPSSRVPNSGRMFASFAAAAREACAAPGEPATIVQSRLRAEPGSDEVEAIVVLAEHGLWACCGVADRDRFVAVHAADAALVDALARKLVEAAR
jgi:ActR/RegA family two-component response regulator